MDEGEASVDLSDLHHASHDKLLTEESIDDVEPARLDAIIVPTAWPVDALRHVMRIGREIGCPVVALCSRAAAAEQAEKLADHLDAPVLAVDVDQSLGGVLPHFATDDLLARHGFSSGSDLSLKRNLTRRLGLPATRNGSAPFTRPRRRGREA